MGIGQLTDRSAVERALEEYLRRGRDGFLSHHGFGVARDSFIFHDGLLYDAKAVAGVAYGYQYPDQGRLGHKVFSGGASGADAALTRLGFTIVRGRPTSVDDERVWRLAVWDHLQHSTGEASRLEPRLLRTFGVYGGAQGIWVDAERTRRLNNAAYPAGITVGLLHTGDHYPDELSDSGLIYHYPRTNRQVTRDASEVAATKAAGASGLPVFVITKPSPSATVRTVKLAWVEGWDEASATFLVSFGAERPRELLTGDNSDGQPFDLEGNRSRRVRRTVRHRPDQQRFKFQVLQRYGARCPLSGVTVPEMIEAAHLRGDADGGTTDPRNGLPLNAALHRAFDAYLFAIDPETLNVVARPGGPSLAEMGITTSHIRDLHRKPHPEALRWRYEEWMRKITATA